MLRSEYIQQLSHHGSHTTKVARTRCPIQAVAQTSDFDECTGAAGVHLLNRRRKNQVNSGGFEYPAILFQRPWIAREVFLGAKLGGVYENRNCHRIATCL